MEKHIYNLKKIIYFASAISITFMFCMDFSKSTSQPGLPGIIDELHLSLQGKGLLCTVLLLFLFAGHKFICHINLPKAFWFVGISFVIATIWLRGTVFVSTTNIPISNQLAQLAKYGVYTIGATAFLYYSFKVFFYFITSKYDLNNPCKDVCSKTVIFFSKHVIFCISVALIFLWAFGIIICYPGYMCNDSWIQLSQAWGETTFTTHHPPIHSLLIAFFTWMGKTLGNGNIGLYGFIIMQVILFSTIIAYSFKTMYSLKCPKWLLVITFLTAAFSPYYANQVTVVLKDNLYSVAILLFIIEMIQALTNIEAFIHEKKHIIMASFSIMGIMLFRNNGKYVLYPTILFALVILFIKRKTLTTKCRIYILGLLTIPVFLAILIQASAVHMLNIQKGSIAEALSLPFQQTARCVMLHGNELSEYEIKIIDNVLDYNQLPVLYDTSISDPVKKTFRSNIGRDELMQYLKVWFRMFTKYPGDYINATLNQNYYLLYPFIENRAVFMSYEDFDQSSRAALEKEINIHSVHLFDASRNILYRWYNFMHSVPVIGLLSNPAFYTILLLYMTVLALITKKPLFLLTVSTSLISVLVIIAGPVIQGHPRYAFPIIYTLPIQIAFYMYLEKKKEN